MRKQLHILHVLHMLHILPILRHIRSRSVFISLHSPPAAVELLVTRLH